MKRFISLIFVILAACFSAYGSEENVDLAKVFDLKQILIDGAVLYYDEKLESRLPLFKDIYLENREKYKKASTSETEYLKVYLASGIEILNEIKSLVGFTGSEGCDRCMQEYIVKVNEKGYDTTIPFIGTNNSIYLIPQADLKGYMRQGGKISSMQYDKQTDKAFYMSAYDSCSDNSSDEEFVFPIDSEAKPDEFESFVRNIFDSLLYTLSTYSRGKDSSLVKDLAGSMISSRFSEISSHEDLWFKAAAENVITLEILMKYFTQKEVDEFLAKYSTDKYKDLKAEIDMEHWVRVDGIDTKFWPVEREKDYRIARQAFATELMVQVVKDHGIEVVKQIIDCCISDKDSSPGIFAAIKKVTGSDYSGWMGQFKHFESRDAGIDYYTGRLKAVDAKANPGDKIFYEIRMLELMDDKSLRSSYLWFDIFKISTDNGWKMFAEIYYKVFAIAFDAEYNIGISDQPQYGEFILFLALIWDRPSYAKNFIEGVLENNPADIKGLTVLMKSMKDKSKAKKLAEKIIMLETDKDNFCYKEAMKVLEGDK